MAIPLDDFLDGYPEYLDAPADLVVSKLVAAETRLDPYSWGAVYTQAAMLLGAHLIAISPYGQEARLASKEGSSTYLVEFERLRTETITGAQVL